MQKSYWDNIASNFEDEIFSVYDNDASGLISSAVRKHGAGGKTASDIGCGTGSFLPLMSEQFRHVTAVDISPKVLSRAEKACADLDNVTFRVADLSRPGTRLPKVDTCLCVNVLLTPSLKCRIRMLDILCAHIKPGGHLILTVPSLESAMLTHSRLIEWNLRTGVPPSHASSARFSRLSAREAAQMRSGTIHIDGVPHKHYLADEISHSLSRRGLVTVESKRINYKWDTEFNDPPDWMQAPYPWDWLIVGHRKK